MGNAASTSSDHRNRNGGMTEEEQEKLRTLASLSSRILIGSQDSVSEQQLGSSPGLSGLSVNANAQQAVSKPRTILSASLKDRGLIEVPAEVYELFDLTALDLSNNKLREFPTGLTRLSQLKRLSLGSNNITSIPDDIVGMRELMWLDFTHTDVSWVSPNIAKLSNLASLGASDCRLTEFPVTFCQIPNLRKLGMFNNMITSLPHQIGSLRGLTKLDLSGNALTRLPDEICQLTELAWLNLSRNQLVELPEEFGKLAKLKELGLAFNKLKRLPDLSGLVELDLLPVYNNELEEVGEWICEMPALTKLDLSFNRLTELPEGIFRNKALTFINLRNNLLRSVPPYDSADPSARSPTLDTIDLRHNLIESIPISLMSPSIREFRCSDNPLTTVPGLTTNPQREIVKLQHLALNSLVINYGMPIPTDLLSPLLHEAYQLAYKSAHKICPNCHRKYILPEARSVIFVETTDSPMAPFVLEACSQECIGRFRLVGGVHFPSYHVPMARIDGDPRSPTLIE